MAEAFGAIKHAQKEILIADWQLVNLLIKCSSLITSSSMIYNCTCI